ncbi:MAG: phosphoenolpyruvate--protein phosphotransferase [Defluviicoccus sp.]
MQFGQTVLVLRRLLARIRDVMAGEGDTQARLERIVQVIAVDMGSQVCSLYVRRAGDVLELFATHGLRQSAVHRTRLAVGQGLIGEIAAKAKPLALADAQSHPSFVYRPETGEEIYHSLMGVPILRGGRVVGVLAIQSIERRRYSDEEIEALQTIAMVLAEMVASGNLVGPEELASSEAIAMPPMRLEGARLSPGFGLGIAVLHKHHHVVRRLVAEDTAVEHERLRKAVSDMHGQLDVMLRANGLAGGEHAEVLEAYRMIAEDVGWLRRIAEAINTGLTAEAAVQKVNSEIHAQIARVTDSYLRERIQDLEDLAQRLLQQLLGAEERAQRLPQDQDFVVVARTLGPAQLLDYSCSRLKGLVLQEGSANAHVAIVARSLGIPVVGQIEDVMTRIESGDPVIVDPDHGQVLLRPSADLRRIYERSSADRARRRAEYTQLRDLEATTRDGVRISLTVNAGLAVDLQPLSDSGVDGVGLYRTEVPFMVYEELPTVELQRQLYRQVLHDAKAKPVVFRTLDVGGDKILPYWPHGNEENPAMGWRAIRVSWDRPAVLRQQLRALIQAAADEHLHVMFPMISEVEEFRFARRLLDLELERHSRTGLASPLSIRAGAMLEVPALLFQLDELVQVVDFLSIGTNDLVQFLFASDRASHRMSERYDVLSPVVLRLLRMVADRCREARVPLSLCGEMAGRPLDAMALIGIGLRQLSMAPPCIGPVKAMVRTADAAVLADFVSHLTTLRQVSVRADMRAFAHDHGIALA